MDYSVFDSLLDSVIVIDEDRTIKYCNEAAASLLDSSVKRLSKGKTLYDIIEIDDSNLFLMPSGLSGKEEPLPFTEVKYTLKRKDKSGKVQVATQPFNDSDGPRWVILIRDVTLEEVLHGKYRRELEGKEKLIEELREAHAKLEEYSKNLEQMVDDRTKELNSANRTLKAIMDSLGQGFLVIDPEGKCGDVYTKVCEDILESTPPGKDILDVLRLDGEDRKTMSSWMDASFSEALPFDSLKELGPSKYNHSRGKHITLDYHALRDADNSVENIVMVATDKTDEVKANEALEKERAFAKMILKMVSAKDQFSRFLLGSDVVLDELDDLSSVDASEFDHKQVYRILHTMEGEAGTFAARDLVFALKECQEVMEPLKTGWADDPAKTLIEFRETLLNLRNSFKNFRESNKELLLLIGVGDEAKIEIDRVKVEKVISELRLSGVEASVCLWLKDELLREPLSKGLKHYNETVRTIANAQNKRVELVGLDSLDVRLYLDYYDELLSSFVHLFRNAVDHGIEPPSDRELAGKPEMGRISLKAKWIVKDGSNWLEMSFSDDGCGIDPKKLIPKLEQRNPNVDWKSKPSSEIIQTIFQSGLSSRDEVGMFSGRGIGMDAVKHQVDLLGGEVWVESSIGVGSTVFILVPDIVEDRKIKAVA